MPDARFTARYRIETPLPLEQVAEIMAGEQSCGTIREAGRAVARGDDLETASPSHQALADALVHFGASS